MVEWLIASGRDLGDLDKEGNGFTALDAARMRGCSEVASLLERFRDDPAHIRHELRVKLAAELFALNIFFCDGLLQLKPVPSSNPAAAVRFLTITKRLPMELQMILCHRAVGSAKDSILSKDSEEAFKSLARILVLSQSKSR